MRKEQGREREVCDSHTLGRIVELAVPTKGTGQVRPGPEFGLISQASAPSLGLPASRPGTRGQLPDSHSTFAAKCASEDLQQLL